MWILLVLFCSFFCFAKGLGVSMVLGRSFKGGGFSGGSGGLLFASLCYYLQYWVGLYTKIDAFWRGGNKVFGILR